MDVSFSLKYVLIKFLHIQCLSSNILLIILGHIVMLASCLCEHDRSVKLILSNESFTEINNDLIRQQQCSKKGKSKKRYMETYSL